ncbi:MAG: cobaltochelatase subunit CobN [Planctomycetota bacterium]|nr:MAG: cobaltochelatase subunit CobN [Planctomycetota bacterium]
MPAERMSSPPWKSGSRTGRISWIWGAGGLLLASAPLLFFFLSCPAPLGAGAPPQQPARAVFLGAWDRARPLLERAAADRGWSAEFFADAELARVEPEKLAAADAVLVLNIPPAAALGLADHLSAARTLHPRLPVLALDRRETQAGLRRRGLLSDEDELTAYWRAGGLENYRRMFAWLRRRLLGEEVEVAPPLQVPTAALWHPDAPSFFTDVAAFRAWLEETGRLEPSDRRVALVTQQSFLVLEDTAVHRAIVRDLEGRGVAVAVLFADRQDTLLEMLRAWKPELILDDGHASPMLLAGAAELDVPQIKTISMLRTTLDDWRRSPLGLDPGDVSLHLLTQEVYGIIDPQVVGGLVENIQGYRLHEPDPERVAHLGRRVAAWLSLRATAPADRRIAVVYYHKYLGDGDILRGSPSGAFLDGPASLLRVLRALRAAGYRVDPLPADEEELIALLRRRGRNVAAWAKGDLRRLVEEGDPVLLPVERYRSWLESLPTEAVRRVEAAHGRPPGRQMSWRENGRDFFVLPRIDLGGVVLMPQPARGPENDERLLHARDVPPPHQYLAAYLWLQHEADVDAVVHFGTHGSELLLPEKAAGLGPEDYSDICLGDLPAVTPWVLDNVAEATLARRRSYAVLVDHLTPAYEAAGLAPDLEKLSRLLDQFATLEEGILRERYRHQISVAARQAAMAPEGNEDLSDDALAGLAADLHGIRSRVAPMSLHVLGRPPTPERLIGMVASMLGPEAEADLGGREAEEILLRAALLEGDERAQEALGRWRDTALDHRDRLLGCEDEIGNLLHALDGGFVPPGPGNDPVRNPAAAPTGRNLYALNPEEIPTPAAWQVGAELGRQLLERRPDLRKVAFDLNAFETMRDYGVMEAEILWLIGVRPVWDENGLVVDVELVPREELEHPRLDVFIAISGAMRDNFPSRVRLLDRAIRLAAAQKEPDNRLRSGVARQEKLLRAAGFAPERAAALAPARIFGQRPGEYGTRVLYLVPQSGSWQDEKEVAEVYLENMAYVFTGDLWGEKVDGLYRGAMAGTDLVLRNWASNMMSPLSNHHVYEYAGGLSMALAEVTGKEPELWLNDVRERDPRLRDFASVLREEFHSTLLNPKWQQGMKEHGYAGAGQMAELVKNAFGWSVTRPGSVEQAVWDKIHADFVEDRNGLGLRDWFARRNPAAFQEIAATLLEAARKGYWQASEETRRGLARAYAAAVAASGYSAGLVAGGNRALQDTIRQLLGGPADRELLAAWEQAVAVSEREPSGETVRGLELTAAETEAETPAPETAASKPPPDRRDHAPSPVLLVAGAAAALFLIGLTRRSGGLA